MSSTTPNAHISTFSIKLRNSARDACHYGSINATQIKRKTPYKLVLPWLISDGVHLEHLVAIYTALFISESDTWMLISQFIIIDISANLSLFLFFSLK